MPQDCVVAFLVGLIEGDGSIRLIPYRGEQRLIIEFISASSAMANWYRKVVALLIKSPVKTPCFHVKKNGQNNPVYKISLKGARAESLGKILLTYQGAMDRKWDCIRNFYCDTAV